MATVFKIIPTNEDNRYFEPATVNGDLHAALDAERTFCGIQLDGDDGYEKGNDDRGYVTCSLCAFVIRKAKSIENWESPIN